MLAFVHCWDLQPGTGNVAIATGEPKPQRPKGADAYSRRNLASRLRAAPRASSICGLGSLDGALTYPQILWITSRLSGFHAASGGQAAGLPRKCARWPPITTQSQHEGLHDMQSKSVSRSHCSCAP